MLLKRHILDSEFFYFIDFFVVLLLGCVSLTETLLRDWQFTNIALAYVYSADCLAIQKYGTKVW